MYPPVIWRGYKCFLVPYPVYEPFINKEWYRENSCLSSLTVVCRDERFFFTLYSKTFSENGGMIAKNVTKYKRQYFMPPVKCMKWAEKEYVDKAPIWCSVDLRDGNQALVIPMSLEQKVEFFKLLVEIGFKEIEVGFPAASETEYTFIRTLIEQNLIPDDVTIQVLTQAREHHHHGTFEAVKVLRRQSYIYITLLLFAQREQVFKKSKEEILKIAVDGNLLLKELADQTEGNFQFEYSPESFTGTEPEYALEVCSTQILDV